MAESAAAGEMRSLCSAVGLQAAVVIGEHVVLAAPSVGSAVLQADTAAKQKPVSTEKYRSYLLFQALQQHTNTYRECRAEKER